MKRHLLFVIFCVLPARAQLFFVMPPTEAMSPGDIRVDAGLVHGKYFIIGRDQERTYAPDLKIHAQFAGRVAFGFEGYGVARSESLHEGEPVELEDDLFTGGDFVVTSWIDLVRRPTPWQGLKGFVRIKIPSADDTKGVGSDETDLFLGLTTHYQKGPILLAGLLRMDIVGRDRDQWDYVTTSLRYGYRLSPRFTLLAEGWFRRRSSNHTTLLSGGLVWQVTDMCRLELLAGDGDWSHFEGNPDSRLYRQASLQFKWRFHSPKMRAWLE